MPDDASLNVRAFKVLCWSRVYRWRHDLFEPDEPQDDIVAFAIDPLQRWAVDHGLVDEIGQDAVQRILAEAFDG